MTSKSNSSWNEAHNTALEFAWGEYRVWAATARALRGEIFSWRLRVMLLTLAGAVLGVLASELGRLELAQSWLPTLAKILGFASGGALVLAAYFSREILKTDQERNWVRARSIAEAFKSEAYLFRVAIAPYDTSEAPSRLIENTNELLQLTQNLPAENLTKDQRRERLPSSALTINEYIHERVDDQIDNYYQPRARQHAATVKRIRTISLVLGGIAALFGLLSSTEWAAGWVAVLTTATASISAYLYAGRYQYLLISYQATAAQLEALKRQWLVQGKSATSPEQVAKFVQACEDAISVENNAWMSRWLESAPEAGSSAVPVPSNP